MLSPDSGAARLTRAVLLSGEIVALAAAAHVLAHGAVPPVASAVLAAAASLPVTILMSGGRFALPWVIVVMSIGQLVLHRFFELSAACSTGASVGLGHLGHVGHTGSLGVLGGGLTCAHVEHGPSTTPLMLVLHGAATVLTALIVVGADHALWDLLTRVLCRVPALVPLDVQFRTGVLLLGTPVSVLALHLRRHLSHRGPPSIAATWA